MYHSKFLPLWIVLFLFMFRFVGYFLVNLLLLMVGFMKIMDFLKYDIVMADNVSPYNFDMNAAIAAGAQALTGLAGMVYQGEADKQNRKLFRETRDLQRQWALEDYDRILRDSSPQAQMERLKSAGLNPNLVYGSGNIQTGVTSMPRTNSAEIPYRNVVTPDLAMLNVVGNYLDMQQKQAMIDNIRAATANTNQDTENKGAEFENLTIRNDILSATSDALKEQPYLQNELTEAQISNVQTSTELVARKIDMTEEQTRVFMMQQFEIAAKINYLEKQSDLIAEQINTEITKQVLNKANAHYLHVQESVVPALVDMYSSIAALNSQEVVEKKDTYLLRRSELTNKVSNLILEGIETEAKTKLTEAQTADEYASTGSRVMDALISVGDIFLGAYNARTMRARATRQRPTGKKVEMFDAKGKKTGSIVTN